MAFLIKENFIKIFIALFMLHKQNIQKQELKLHETIVLGLRLYNPYKQCMDFAPFIQHCYMRIT